VEWSGVEWSGVEWSGVEWSGVERRIDHSGNVLRLSTQATRGKSFVQAKTRQDQSLRLCTAVDADQILRTGCI